MGIYAYSLVILFMGINPKEIILPLHQDVCIRTCTATYITESRKESKGP